MNFIDHSELAGQHAFLSASSYHWVNYDPDKLVTVYKTRLAAQRGSELHDFARRCIELGQKLPRSNKTLNLYVNDAIGYKMTPEQVLFYSVNCFGTADAISFKNGRLRISDLKTGTTPVKMTQLMIYASLFCLEYNVKPGEIETELRIYQDDDVMFYVPEVDELAHIMDKIVVFDHILEEIQL